MISLNTQNAHKLQLRQAPIASKAANITPSLQQNNALPIFPRGIAFGMGFGYPVYNNYFPGMSNGTYTGADLPRDEKGNFQTVDFDFNFGVNINASNVDLKTNNYLEAADGFSVRSIVAGHASLNGTTTITDGITTSTKLRSTGTLTAGSVNTGNSAEFMDATITNEITTGGDLESKGTLTAGSVNTGSNAKLNNATIKKGITTKGELKSTGTLTAGSVNTGSNAKLNNATIKKGITTGNNLESTGTLKAGSVKTGTSAEFKDATIKKGITTGTNLKSTGTLTAGSVNTGDFAELNNATITDGITTGRSLKSTGTLTAESATSNENIFLNNVKKLNEIHFVRNREAGHEKRTLELSNEEIKTTNPDGQIKVYLGEINSLTIKTPTGDRSILDKFVFYPEGEKFEKKDDKIIDIKPAKIENAEPLNEEQMKFIKVEKLEK